MESGAATETFENLVTEINEGEISNVEHWLHECDEKQIDITERKVDGCELTVLGYAVLSKSDPEVLKILFRRADFNVNFVERSFDERIPLLHLAAYVENLEAVTLLCNSQHINLDVTLYKTHLTALHMSVKGGNPNVVSQVLHKARQYHQPDNPDSFSDFLNRKDVLGMTALHYAAWEGHEDIVTQLLDCPVDVNPKHYDGVTPLHLASWNNRLGVVNKLLAHPRIDPQVACNNLLVIMGDLKVKDRWQTGMQQTLHELEKFLPDCDRRYRDTLVGYFPGPVDTFRLQLKDKIAAKKVPFVFPDLHSSVTALHCAAFAGHSEIVGTLLRAISAQTQAWKTLNLVDDHLMTPLHYAIIGGDASTVGTLASNSMVQGNHEEKDWNLTPLDMASILIRYAKDPSVEHEYKVVLSLLLGRQDVQRYIDDLYQEKQVYLNAVNAFLVVAALIESIAFPAWIQLQVRQDDPAPVLGYSTGTPIPSVTFPYSDWNFQVALFSNIICCYFAIFTMMIGAIAVLPSQAVTRKAELQRIRSLLLCTSMLLSVSVFLTVGVFIMNAYSFLLIPIYFLAVSHCLYVYLIIFRKSKQLTWKPSTKIRPVHVPNTIQQKFFTNCGGFSSSGWTRKRSD